MPTNLLTKVLRQPTVSVQDKAKRKILRTWASVTRANSGFNRPLAQTVERDQSCLSSLNVRHLRTMTATPERQELWNILPAHSGTPSSQAGATRLAMQIRPSCAERQKNTSQPRMKQCRWLHVPSNQRSGPVILLFRDDPKQKETPAPNKGKRRPISKTSSQQSKGNELNLRKNINCEQKTGVEEHWRHEAANKRNWVRKQKGNKGEEQTEPDKKTKKPAGENGMKGSEIRIFKAHAENNELWRVERVQKGR